MQVKNQMPQVVLVLTNIVKLLQLQERRVGARAPAGHVFLWPCQPHMTPGLWRSLVTRPSNTKNDDYYWNNTAPTTRCHHCADRLPHPLPVTPPCCNNSPHPQYIVQTRHGVHCPSVPWVLGNLHHEWLQSASLSNEKSVLHCGSCRPRDILSWIVRFRHGTYPS